MKIDPELEEVIRIARAAERRERAIYATAFTVELKGPGDPVTRADREASDIICESLAASFPGDAILSEEGVPEDPAEVARLGGAKRWDTCAPEAVLTAAGGRMSDLDGAPIDYRSDDLVLRRGIVATNGALHEAVLSAVVASKVRPAAGRSDDRDMTKGP